MATTLNLVMAEAAPVTVTDEAGLRDAIVASPDDGTLATIKIKGSIKLTAAAGETLWIPSDANIALSGGVLSAAGDFTTVTVHGQLTLKDITITHEPGKTGGGVAVGEMGSLFLEDGAEVSGNLGDVGTGVYNKGLFTMNGGKVSDNQAIYRGQTKHRGGGGVLNEGTFVMNGGEISDNIIEFGGPDKDIPNMNADGGGVNNWYDGRFTMSGGTISGNTAAGRTGFGGGVANIGGYFTMTGGSITENVTQDGYGGGVYSAADSPQRQWPAEFKMAGGTIADNEASNCGGVASDNASFAMSSDATITGNYVAYGGGGVCSMSGTAVFSGTISNNAGRDGEGGGIYCSGVKTGTRATCTLTPSARVTENMAREGGGVLSAGADLMLDGATIIGNSAWWQGGGVVNRDHGVYPYSYTPGHMTMKDAVISGNSANIGGGVFVYGALSTTFTMISGTITDNAAARSDSGNIMASGGGVHNNGGTVTLEGGEISGNTAKDYGAGVYNVDGTFALNVVTVSGNTSSLYGGGVYNSNGVVTLDGSTITDNTSGSDGGGVYNSGSKAVFTMNAGTIAGNTATLGSGAGLFNNSGSFIMNSGSVANNTAEYDGGGIGNNYGVVKMNGGAISGNTSVGSGGGAFTYGGEFSMAGTISDNTSVVDGGAISTPNPGELSVTDGKTVAFSGNSTHHAIVPDASDSIWDNEIDPYATSLSTDFGTVFSNFDISYYSGTTHYRIMVNDDGNGSASASQSLAVIGDAVKLTAIPNGDYVFDRWETDVDYYYFNEDTVLIHVDDEPQTTFTMPEGNVTLTAHFKPALDADPGDTTEENEPGDGPSTPPDGGSGGVPDKDVPSVTPSEDEPGTTPSGDGPSAAPSGDGPGATPTEDDPGTTPSEDESSAAPSGDEPGATPTEDDPGTTPSGDGPGMVPDDDPVTTPGEVDPGVSTPHEEPGTAPSGDKPGTAPSAHKPGITPSDERIDAPTGGSVLNRSLALIIPIGFVVGGVVLLIVMISTRRHKRGGCLSQGQDGVDEIL